MVASCRLPFGIPSFSLPSIPYSNRQGLCEAAHCAFVADQAIALDFHSEEQGIVVAVGGGP